MAEPTTATNPKIEELRARLKADSKSRHFYPLAEELRKIHQLEEAEQILRDGLETHASYLSAWICLGRVLRDRSRDHEAVEVLKRALVLDPGNVVAAKLLAQAYLGVGDKVEAIKKYKLVFALMPSDEDVEATIERLEGELNPESHPVVAASPAEEAMVAPEGAQEQSPFEGGEGLPPLPTEQPFALEQEPSRFDMTDPIPFGADEDPFGSTADSARPSLEIALPPGVLDLDQPSGMDEALASASPAEPVEPAQQEAEPFGDFSEAAPVMPPETEGGETGFEAAEPFGEPASPPAQIPATMTMAQLYESQGHEQQAAQVYRQILEHQPDHEQARFALLRSEVPASLEQAAPGGKREVIRRLEQWRARMARS